MNRLIWLSILFLSTSWLFFIPIFNSPDWPMGFIFLTIGILSTIGAFWKHHSISIEKHYIVLIIPLLIAAFFIHYPYNLGLIVLTIGLFLYMLSNYYLHYSKANFVFIGVSFSGVLLTLQTMLYPLYTIFVSHGHRVDSLSLIISSFGNLFGLKTSVNNGIIFVQTMHHTYPFTTTWEKLGLYTWCNILIGAVILFVLCAKKRQRIYSILLFFLVSFFYLILRYVTYLYAYVNTLELGIYWCPFYTTLGFLPLILLLMKIYPLYSNSPVKQPTQSPSILGRKHLIAMILVFICVFSAVGAFTYYDPGVKKQGRVLVDELHSDWEDTIRPLDKNWYGMLSTYNYYSWAEWLGYYYDLERNINSTFTLDFLEQYDIVILKTPTNQYSDEEIQAIKLYVERGGGLYLIGDHTDVFGMNTFLNQISEHFGIYFNTDATYELGTGLMSVFTPDPLIHHPIVHHLDHFEFMTSCTLSAPFISEHVMIGNRLIGEPGTYSTENFFRESIASPDSEFGHLLQVAAVKYGRGRVVAFSDSTVFSSFSMFSDGYQPFTLATMEYLNRENQYAYVNILFMGVFLVFLFAGVYLLRTLHFFNILIVLLAVGSFAFACAAPTFSSINTTNYPLPSPQEEFTQICFEQEFSNYNISLQPRLGLFNEKDHFGTFYVWTQRVGCIPSMQDTLEDAIANGDIVVIINPLQPFTSEDINCVSSYLNQGGRLLVMDSIFNSESSANDLLGNFGLWINYNTIDHHLSPITNASKENRSIGNSTTPYLSITGGENLLVTQLNETSASLVEFVNETTGKTGKIVVFIDSYTFSDAVMGGPLTEPDERQQQIYSTEYYLFEEILLKET